MGPVAVGEINPGTLGIRLGGSELALAKAYYYHHSTNKHKNGGPGTLGIGGTSGQAELLVAQRLTVLGAMKTQRKSCGNF